MSLGIVRLRRSISGGNFVESVEMTHCEADRCEGKIIVKSSRRLDTFRWMARRTDNKWMVTGEGAVINGDRVAAVEKYPFSMDPQLNQELQHLLADFISKRAVS